jgi:hypothetical protein
VPHVPRRLLILCLLLVVVPLTACGSNDETKTTNQYVGEVNAIQNQVAAQFRQAGTALTPTSSRETNSKALDAFDKAVATAVTRLKAVKAPAKVKALHAQLVTEVASYRLAIAAARKALSAKTVAGLTAGQASFATQTAQASAAITSAIDDINRKLHE